MPGGRPSKYTPALVEEICQRLSTGEPLTVICRSDAKFPDPSTVRDWMDSKPDVSRAIARAREAGEIALSEECLRIADTPVEGEETTVEGDKVTVKRGDMLGHRKLQIETRLKLLAKWNPKKWGEKVEVEHTGEVRVDMLKAARERATQGR